MPKGPAARILDLTLHPLPGILQPGPGSPNVLIGGLPAWRGVSAAAAAAIQAAKAASDATLAAAAAATLAAARHARRACGQGGRGGGQDRCRRRHGRDDHRRGRRRRHPQLPDADAAAAAWPRRRGRRIDDRIDQQPAGLPGRGHDRRGAGAAEQDRDGIADGHHRRLIEAEPEGQNGKADRPGSARGTQGALPPPDRRALCERSGAGAGAWCLAQPPCRAGAVLHRPAARPRPSHPADAAAARRDLHGGGAAVLQRERGGSGGASAAGPDPDRRGSSLALSRGRGGAPAGESVRLGRTAACRFQQGGFGGRGERADRGLRHGLPARARRHRRDRKRDRPRL